MVRETAPKTERQNLMGLSIKAGKPYLSSEESLKSWDRAYSTFAQVRTFLAEKAGFGPDYYRLRYGDKSYEDTMRGLWGMWTPEDEFEDDLDPLLMHFDHDGYLMPWTAGQIARRIRQLVPLDTSDIVGYSRGDVEATIAELVEVLEQAEEHYFVLNFS